MPNTNNMMRLNKEKAGAIVFWRILIIAVGVLLVCSLFDYVGSTGEIEFVFHRDVLPVLSIVFPALFLLSAVYLVITIVKKWDTSAHIVTPEMIIAATLYLTATTLLYDRLRNFPTLFYTMSAIAAVLFAVYYIYTIILYKK